MEVAGKPNVRSASQMSGKAVGYVYEKSPYTGATLAVHLAIADVVNDLHGHLLWMSTDKVAAKTRTSRRTVQTAIDTLVEDGFLVLVKKATQHFPATYLFVFPEKPTIFEVSEVQSEQPEVQSTHSGVQSETSRGATIAPELNKTKKQRNKNTYDQLAVDQAFDTFWSNYPRKVQRKKCQAWWNRHKKHSQQILDSLDVWREYWEQYVPDSQFIPYPHTWLNQERWNEPPPAESNTRTNIVLAVLDNINQQQPALETHNDPF
jgi:hypothetical protein